MDYSSAIAHLKTTDPILASVMDQIGNCLLYQTQQTGDLLDSLVRSILYQQLSGKAAATIHHRFLQLYPASSPLTAATLLDTPDQLLRQVGISRSKVIYLKDLAQKIDAGLPTLQDLKDMDDETIIQTLTQVKGIGRWTVQMLLIFRLHRWNVLPVDDLGIRSGIRRVYQLPDLPDKKTVGRLGESWQPYCTIAAWYLWRSLELEVVLNPAMKLSGTVAPSRTIS
jgi:DNA-3-methyladenine glycosylase II